MNENESENRGAEQGSRFLQFNLGEEFYAIPLLMVREVISVPETTSIPQAPGYFRGIMNLRGQIISIIDLRQKLGFSIKENNHEEAVIILDFSEFRLGVVVDAINKVSTVSADDLRDIPLVQNKVSSDYIESVFERPEGLVVVIDIAKALDVTDLTLIKENKAA